MSESNTNTDTPGTDTPGLTDGDRERLGELLDNRKRSGEASKAARGVDVDAVTTALDRLPEDYPPARTLVVAWLFETGPSTSREAAEATGVSYATVKGALDDLVGIELAHTNSSRTFDGRGRDPTVYVPAPNGLPKHL